MSYVEQSPRTIEEVYPVHRYVYGATGKGHFPILLYQHHHVGAYTHKTRLSVTEVMYDLPQVCASEWWVLLGIKAVGAIGEDIQFGKGAFASCWVLGYATKSNPEPDTH